MKDKKEFYKAPSRKEYVERVREANPRVLASFRSYLFEGRECGGFVKACICNRLTDSFGYADDDMKDLINEVVMYLTNCFPNDAWGSEQTYKRIVENGGYFNGKDFQDPLDWAKRQGI